MFIKINPLSFQKFGFRIENFNFFYYFHVVLISSGSKDIISILCGVIMKKFIILYYVEDKMFKAQKESERQRMENQMDKQNRELTKEEIFKLGMEAGQEQLMNHIRHQYEMGKPVEIQGKLFWLKDANQNLQDIMDDLETAWNEEWK